MEASRNYKKVLIFSAPSGSGKTTIINEVLKHFPQLEFSISATSRAKRGAEEHGKHYYFLTADEFRSKIAENAFIEWEEVYTDTYYGTLKSEIDRIWDKQHCIVFDVDVKGGINLKNKFGTQACSIFIQPPSVDELRKRLVARGTDSAEAIEKRVSKAQEELSYAKQFDKIVINDNLQTACQQVQQIITQFLATE